MSDHRVEPSNDAQRSGFRGGQGSLGAFGLEITGLTEPHLLNALPAGADWPHVHVTRQVQARPPRPSNAVGRGRADIALLDGDRALMDRVRRSATLFTTSPGDDGRMVHPFLSVVGAVFGWWLGRDVLHAGALSIDGRGWAVIGEQGSGKSSLLAQLGATGETVMADDLVVLEDGAVLAGPRCVDLRTPALELIDPGRPTQAVRAGGRHRLLVDPAPLAVPLRGWMFLSWGSRLRVQRLGPGERLRRLSRERSAGSGLLELARLPGWELERPRDSASLTGAAELVLDMAAAVD
jgi:hypothetical protein